MPKNGLLEAKSQFIKSIHFKSDVKPIILEKGFDYGKTMKFSMIFIVKSFKYSKNKYMKVLITIKMLVLLI